MIKTKKQMFIVIGAFALVMMLGTVTYAFFNYTRTGSANNIRTGRIAFNTTQNGSINLTDVFPIDSQAAQTDTTNAKSVTITVTGDTDYSEGLEYLVTLADVNLTLGEKKLPIVLEVTATNLGTLEEGDYYTAHTNYTTTNKYKILYDGTLEEDARVLAGYIAPNTVLGTSNNTSGTITIKAYIDKSRILISDTYPAGTVREVNTTNYSASVCETATGLASGSAICASASSLQTELDSGNTLTNAQITALINAGVIREYSNGTINPDDKIVFTTEEWNSIQRSPLSFKVRVESKEGIWVEEPSKGIESCPDCKFMYYVEDPNDIAKTKWTTWNNQNQTPTQITSGLYDNYEELIEATGKNYFLGVKLNSNNEVTNAYACGVKDNEPFCLEGTSDGSKYTANQTLLQGANLYNNSCTVKSNYTECGPWDNSGPVFAYADSDGIVDAGVGFGDDCYVDADGSFVCLESEAVGPGPGGGGDSP